MRPRNMANAPVLVDAGRRMACAAPFPSCASLSRVAPRPRTYSRIAGWTAKPVKVNVIHIVCVTGIVMRPEGERHVRTMRALLRTARVENSRMVAAAIGGHLARISRVSPDGPVEAATDAVRDASLGLLRALHHGEDVRRARMAALRSIETLQAVLPSDMIATPDRTGERRPAAVRQPAADTRSLLRKLTSRTLPFAFAVRS